MTDSDPGRFDEPDRDEDLPDQDDPRRNDKDEPDTGGAEGGNRPR